MPTETAEIDLPDEEFAALERVLSYIDDVRANAKRNPRYGFDRPWRSFARLMLLLTPQSYGGRMQRYFAEWYGWRGIAQSEDTGDVWDGDERTEVKVSFITGTNARANFVQIRPWQQIEGYRCFVIDTDLAVWRFDLDKDQMADELRRTGQIAHGTAGAVAANVNREYAIRLTWDPTNEHTARWLAKYLSWGPTPDRSSRPERDDAAPATAR